MDLSLSEHTIRIHIITLGGRLEAATVPRLREAQEGLLAGGAKDFIVDLGAVTFMDSAGMAALVSLLKRSRQAGGNIVLVKPQDPAAYRILSLTRFDQVFTIATNTQDALKRF